MVLLHEPGADGGSAADRPAAERQLAELEAVIANGLQTFVEVGRALLQIGEGRLYRTLGYATFSDYVEQRWDISRSYAYRQIEAARVLEVLEPLDGEPLPANEAQARELARLWKDPEAMREVWHETVRATGGRVTARRLRQRIDARRRRLGLAPRPALAPAGYTVTCPSCGRAVDVPAA